MNTPQCQVICGHPATHYHRQGRWAILICKEHAYHFPARVFIIPPSRSRFRRLLLEFGISPIHGSGSHI